MLELACFGGIEGRAACHTFWTALDLARHLESTWKHPIRRWLVGNQDDGAVRASISLRLLTELSSSPKMPFRPWKVFSCCESKKVQQSNTRWRTHFGCEYHGLRLSLSGRLLELDPASDERDVFFEFGLVFFFRLNQRCIFTASVLHPRRLSLPIRWLPTQLGLFSLLFEWRHAETSVPQCLCERYHLAWQRAVITSKKNWWLYKCVCVDAKKQLHSWAHLHTAAAAALFFSPEVLSLQRLCCCEPTVVASRWSFYFLNINLPLRLRKLI